MRDRLARGVVASGLEQKKIEAHVRRVEKRAEGEARLRTTLKFAGTSESHVGVFGPAGEQ